MHGHFSAHTENTLETGAASIKLGGARSELLQSAFNPAFGGVDETEIAFPLTRRPIWTWTPSGTLNALSLPVEPQALGHPEVRRQLQEPASQN
mmetsp:Transcript_36685/g.64608  ORF Transcript_36685/g.64608 Transcript_36685/m.64608 type:complete len:93 (+) Transcript_36685:47-325(+)